MTMPPLARIQFHGMRFYSLHFQWTANLILPTKIKHPYNQYMMHSVRNSSKTLVAKFCARPQVAASLARGPLPA